MNQLFIIRRIDSAGSHIAPVNDSAYMTRCAAEKVATQMVQDVLAAFSDDAVFVSEHIAIDQTKLSIDHVDGYSVVQFIICPITVIC